MVERSERRRVRSLDPCEEHNEKQIMYVLSSNLADLVPCLGGGVTSAVTFVVSRIEGRGVRCGLTDDYGVTTVVERGFARRMSVRLGVPFDQADALQRTLADLRARPATWIADERFGSLSFQGFYKDFSLDLATPPLSLCTLTIEGLVATEPFIDSGADPAPDGAGSTLRLLRPVVIRSAQLLASNVAETDAAEWQSGTAYPIGARVLRAETHRVYESAAAANVGNDPSGSSGKWIDIGPTNRWAMFDQALGTATRGAGSVAVTLGAGPINAVALLDVAGDAVRVQAPGYDRTVPVGAGAVTFLDLPGIDGQVTVTIAGSGDVAIGTLLVGTLVPLGNTEASPTAAITDFSRKVVDDFGDVTIVERAWAKRMTANALIRTDAVDQVAGRIAAVRALPSLWIGQDGLDSLTVYGFFKDFSIEIGESVSKLALSIEGLSKAAPVMPFAPGGSVAWPDVTDPIGTKPTDNADVTGENTSKDTNAVGGKPSADFLSELAAAQAYQADLNTNIIPAINAAVAGADARIEAVSDEASAAVADARARLDVAVLDLANEIARAQGADEELVRRIDSIEAGGGYDDTAVHALIERSETARADGDRALAERIDTVVTSYQNLDTATNTRITDTARALANATTAVGERASVLESQASPSGGNLVPNSSLSTLDGWNLSANPDALTSLSLNGAGATWMIGGVENNLTLFRGPAGVGLCSEVQSSPFAVRAGSTIQAYAFTAAHRCRAWVSVFFLRGAEFLGYAGENIGARIDAGGQDINAHDQTGVMEYVVPVGTTYAILVLRAYDVTADGYAWFSRPFVTEVRPGTKTWAPYSAGNDRGVAAATRALVSSTATTLADADRAIGQRIDSVTADYQGRDANTNARVDQVATSSASANQAVADLTTSVSTRFDGVYGTLGSYDQRITSLSTDQQGYVGRTSTLEAQMSRQAPSALNTFTDDVNNRVTQVDTSVNARIKSSEDVIADLPNRYAAASRTAALEAQVNNAADSGLQRTVNARIEERAAAIADDRAGAVASTLAQLRAEYNGSVATIAQQAGAIAGIDGRTSVFWSITGTTPDGSTRISLSKSDGSAGVFYIGANLLVDGNAIFNGTVTIRALDRSTMTATTASSVSGSYGGVGTGALTYIPNLGADMFIRSGGSLYFTFTGNIAGQTDSSGSTYPSIELLNAADNSVLASIRLPLAGFGSSGRLDNYTIRILNVWGELTVRWRVATRASSNTWSIVQNPALSVYWTAL
jgi:hypothetical protein